MALLCEHCQAENRNAAKFCIGCGRKIAQSWPGAAVAELATATGSGSATPAMAPLQRANQAPAAAASVTSTPAPAAQRARPPRAWMLVALVTFVLVVAGLWLALGQRGATLDSADAARAATVPALAMAPPPALAKPPSSIPAVTPHVPTAAATASAPAVAETAPIASAPAAAPAAAPDKPKPTPRKRAAKPAPAPAVAPEPPPAAVVATPPAPPTPQEACADRGFIAKSRCLADQCAQPAQRAHPQCAAVREQQRLEEEKRNPQLGA